MILTLRAIVSALQPLSDDYITCNIDWPAYEGENRVGPWEIILKVSSMLQILCNL